MSGDQELERMRAAWHAVARYRVYVTEPFTHRRRPPIGTGLTWDQATGARRGGGRTRRRGRAALRVLLDASARDVRARERSRGAREIPRAPRRRLKSSSGSPAGLEPAFLFSGTA